MTSSVPSPEVPASAEPISPAKTPGALWRQQGQPDPHGDRYNCERHELIGGAMTDDEVANALFLASGEIQMQTAAKDRIRWLSRREARVVELEAALAAAEESAEHWRNAVSDSRRVGDGLLDNIGEWQGRAIRAEHDVAQLTDQRAVISAKYTEWMERALAAEAAHKIACTDADQAEDRAEAAEARATAAEGNMDVLNEAKDILVAAERARTTALLEALRQTDDVLELAYNQGDFRNGNTDSTGTIDEGDVRMGEIIRSALDAARAAILAHGVPNERK